MAESKISEARAAELFARSEYAPSAGKFLTPAEQADYCRSVRSMGSSPWSRFFLWGGCRGAERRVPIFLPEFMCPQSAVSADFESDIFDGSREDELLRLSDGWNMENVSGIVPLHVSGGGFVPLSHRDYLGGLLALGLERDVTGDIIIGGDADAVIFVTETIADFVTENFTRAGRDKVKAYRTGLPADFSVERRTTEIILISASMRLDGIVRAFTSESRETSQELITSGLTSVNYRTETRVDLRVTEGSVISVRGYGKIKITGCRGETRSGRNRIIAQKYV